MTLPPDDAVQPSPASPADQGVDGEATRPPTPAAPAPTDPEGTKWSPQVNDPEGTRWPGSADPESTKWQAGVQSDAVKSTLTSPSQQVASGQHLQPCRFGDYELLAELARGGMGVVYRARHIPSDRLVALKRILSGSLPTAHDIQRFRTEAQAAASLDHPHIVPIYEIGEVSGQHYFTMALANGGSLQQRLREGPLPPRVAARLLQQVAEAVQHAHDKGILHRDIKPHNILLFSSETPAVGSVQVSTPLSSGSPAAVPVPRLADFGLARLGQDSELTRTGQVLGTPSYMPPEQTLGLKQQLGPSADVYSLGAVLYGLLTGRPPFQSADVVETMRQVREDEPVTPRSLNKSIPQDLESVCLRCLAKEPQRRYASARALAEDLGRFLVGEPTQARPVGALERGWRWCGRYPVVAGLVAAVVLTLVLGAMVAGYFAYERSWEAKAKAREANRANAALAELQREAEKTRQEYQARVLVFRMALYAKDYARAWDHYNNHDLVATREALNALPVDLRGWEWDYLQRQCQRKCRIFPTPAGNVCSVRFSPDGKQIVSASSDQTVTVWDVHTGQQLSLKGHTDAVNSAAFSPDGKQIVSASSDQTVTVWDVHTGQQQLSLKGHADGVNSAAFSPDGKRIVSGSRDKDLKVWDAQSGQELLSLKGHKYFVNSVSFSPDGKHIVSGAGDNDIETAGEIKVWEADKGAETFTLPTHSVASVAFSPDGKRLVSGCGKSLEVWDAQTGQKLLSLNPDSGKVHGVSYSPDGKRLVSASERFDLAQFKIHDEGKVMVWDAQTGQALYSLREDTGSAYSVSYSPDGKRLVSARDNQTLQVWDVQTGQEPVSALQEQADVVKNVNYSPNCKRLVSVDARGAVQMRDAGTGQVLFSLKGHQAPVNSASYSPDGQHLVSADESGTVKVWDARNGQELLSLQGHTEAVAGVSYSPDGKRIVSTGGGVQVWEARTGQPLLFFRPHTGRDIVSSLSCSPDGERLAIGGEYVAEGGRGTGEVKVWETQTGQELLFLKGHHTWVLSVSYSPDGQRLVSADASGVIKVWDARTGQELLSLEGDTAWVRSVSYSPDGKRIVSASGGYWLRNERPNKLKVWDAQTGQELLSLKAGGSVDSVRFSPDGKRLVSTNGLVWDANKDEGPQ